jgi:hypothetical protein
MTRVTESVRCAIVCSAGNITGAADNATNTTAPGAGGAAPLGGVARGGDANESSAGNTTGTTNTTGTNNTTGTSTTNSTTPKGSGASVPASSMVQWTLAALVLALGLMA